MSEENSNKNRQEPSIEPKEGDQRAHLDALIDQFDDDFDLGFADETEMVEPAIADQDPLIEPAQADELDDLLSELETGEESEQVEKNSSSIVVLLISIVAIAVLCTLIWQDFTGGEKQVVAIDQAVTDRMPAANDNQPVAVKDQQEFLPALKTTKEKEEQAAEAEQMAAAVAVVEPQERAMQTEPADPSASKDILSVDPVAPEVVPAKARKISWAVNLTSVSTLASAVKIQQVLKNRGIMSEVKQATIGGKSYYRIRIGGFASKDEAQQVRAPLMKEKEFASAWLESYREVVRSPE